MHKLFLISIGIILLVSCSKKSETKKVISDKMAMQLLSFDDKNRVFEKNNFISASLQLNDGEEMLYNRFYHHVFQADSMLATLFSHLKEGDSAVFYIQPSWLKQTNLFEVELPEVTNNELLLYVKVYHYFNKEEQAHFLEQLDEDVVEYQYLNFYLKSIQSLQPIKQKGMYVVSINEGEGKPIAKDDSIQIKYKGYFLNHVLFDATPENGFLAFEYGTPNQVIKGLEFAIKGMKVGEKSKIIIPSHLAFGAKGSSTGIVPPATPVMYELEILKINPTKKK